MAKSKEQLAEEYLTESGMWNPDMDGHVFDEYRRIYLAGFRTASMMCANKLFKSSDKFMRDTINDMLTIGDHESPD